MMTNREVMFQWRKVDPGELKLKLLERKANNHFYGLQQQNLSIKERKTFTQRLQSIESTDHIGVIMLVHTHNQDSR